MTEPASVLAMARSISDGRAGTLSTDMTAKGPDSEKGVMNQMAAPGSGRQSRFGVHTGIFFTASWVIYDGVS